MQAETNVFAQHPKGFRVHIKLLVEEPAKVVAYLDTLVHGLEEKGYKPDEQMGRGAAPKAAAAQGESTAVFITNEDGSRSCSVHGPAKWIPPGTSQAGKPYKGFWACQVQGCKPKAAA